MKITVESDVLEVPVRVEAEYRSTWELVVYRSGVCGQREFVHFESPGETAQVCLDRLAHELGNLSR